MSSPEFNSILDELNFVRSEMAESFDTFAIGLLIQGYLKAVSDFAIWKDGQQTIGCMGKTAKEINEQMMKSLEGWNQFRK